MEHPILFISLVLQALGLPVPHTVVGHTFIEQLCTPYMTYTWFAFRRVDFLRALRDYSRRERRLGR